ncbi:MAG: SDR family NAD(P)-dependent oxidoreductase [Novosphingobium sp.]|nr:SDR family NAD(P)-dependent oxidoreductase [Novosphingobium sp.]
MERQDELNLTGKVVIITGASRGVGKQAALHFARRRAKIVIAARSVETIDSAPDTLGETLKGVELTGTLGETMKEIEALGGEALAVRTDLANRNDLKNLVDKTVERFGGVDILVNNAASTVGSVWDKKFLDLTFEEWSNDFDINLHAPFILMQLVTPIMAEHGEGRIINLTTGSGEVFRLPEEQIAEKEVVGRNLTVPSYFASKRALDRLGSVIAPHLRAMNVYVIGLNPGWVATELVQQRLKRRGFDPKEGDSRPVPMSVPARMIVYFASCKNPNEYTGRLFWAEREMAEMEITAD